MVDGALGLHVAGAIVAQDGVPFRIIMPISEGRILIGASPPRLRREQHGAIADQILLQGQLQRLRHSIECSRQRTRQNRRLKAALPLKRHCWPAVSRCQDVALDCVLEKIVERGERPFRVAGRLLEFQGDRIVRRPDLDGAVVDGVAEAEHGRGCMQRVAPGAGSAERQDRSRLDISNQDRHDGCRVRG